MKTLARAAVAVWLGLGSAAVAAQQSWPKEATSLLGIELGVDLTAQKFPTCSSYMPPANLGVPGVSPCRSGSDFGGLPYLGFPYQAHAITHRGKVAKVLLRLDHDAWHTMRRVLIERFGEPTQRTQEDVSTAAGGRFTSETMVWVGTTARLTAYERLGRVTDTAVTFEHLQLADEMEASRKQKLKDAAGKL